MPRMIRQLVRRSLRTRLLVQGLEQRVTPATFTVSLTGDSGPGTLRQAMLDANSVSGTDDIVFNTAVFANPQVILLTNALPDITDSVNIKGTTAANCNIVRSGAAVPFRIFNFNILSTGAVSMSNITIQNGSTTGQGAGIFMADDFLVLDHCVVKNNTASGSGGGIALASGSLAALFLDTCTLSGNSSGTRGGGVYFNTTGTLAMDNTTVSGNIAAGSNGGGGLYFFTNNVTIRNSTISNNSATNGIGGGINMQSTATVTIQNSTISINSAKSNGGGINRSAGTLSIESTIVAVNTSTSGVGDDINGSASFAKNNLIGEIDGSSGITDPTNKTGTKALPLDPQMSAGNFGGPTTVFMPTPISPAINGGSNPAGLLTDQRGNPFDRQRGAGIDIGAVEAFTNLVVFNTNDSGTGSLRQAVLAGNAEKLGGETINFDPTAFNSAQTIKLTTGELPITTKLAIDASTVVGTVTVSGNNNSRIFNVNISGVSELRLTSLNLTNGNSNNLGIGGDGGAIRVGDDSLYLTRCTITNCFTDLNYEAGGAIAVFNGGSVTADSSIFSNNKCQTNGGAIAFYVGGLGPNGGSLNLTNCTLTGNTGPFGGGAIAFYGNVSPGGFNIANTTISGNSASSGSGGGIDIASSAGTFNIRNSTIVNNKCIGGGGIRVGSVGPTINIESSIVANNIDTSVSSPIPDISSPGTVNVNRSAIGSGFGFTATGVNNLPYGANLKLGPLANNGGPVLTHMPAADSPLVDQGSNLLGLTTDARGFSRAQGFNYDIGAVEVQTNQVYSINRINSNPTGAATVAWSVNVSISADAFTGLSASNFALSGGGAAGASIASVSGGGTIYTVVANTGAEGSLELDFVNASNLSVLPSNLPFAGQAYFVDKTPVTVAISANPTTLTDAKAIPNGLTLTATFTEPMNTAVTPTFSFPVENPGPALVLASGAWVNGTTFQANYNVADTNLSLNNIDVRISGALDSGSNPAGPFTKADVFNIDTQNPLVAAIARNNPGLNNLPTVSWTVTFSEAVTGLSSTNFSLFNGGLGGVPAITSVVGGGTTWTVTASGYAGEGTLGLYVTSTAGVADAVGNPLAGLPVTAPSYAIDPIAPRVLELKINDGAVQRSRVTSVTLKFLELVTFSGPPANAFTLTGPNGPVTLSVDTSASTPIQTVARLTFSGSNTEFTSLKDGRYTLTIAAAQVADLAGNLLDGNGDGAGGDNYVLASAAPPNPPTNIFRLFGDADGNGIVDGVDFGAFRSAFNTNSSIFDFDGSGIVDGADFGQFRSHFGAAV